MRRRPFELPGRLAALGLLLAVLLLGAAGPATAAAPPVLPAVTQKMPEGTPCPEATGTPVAGVPWAQEFLDVDGVTRHSTGAGVRIGLVDTGVDVSAVPGLAGRVRTLPPVYAQGPAAATSAKDRAKAARHRDCVGHGTAMASLIAAPAGPQPGVHGLAPDATIVSVKATDDAGNTDADHLAAGIGAVLTAGARIVAVGTATVTDSPALTAVLARAARAGVLVIAPARYDAQTDDGAVQPAASPGVLSVSDVGPGGFAPEQVPTGSPVALAAPGDRVVALGNQGRGQVTGSGPSYAVAYVAAAAALVSSYRTESGAALAARLLGTAAPPPGGGDPQLGRGVLDVRAALDTEFGADAHAVAPVAPRVRAAPPRHTGLPVALGVAGGAAVVLLLSAGTAFSVLARRRRLAPT